MEANNMKAMREALEKCRALAETIWQSKGGEDVSAEIAELKDLINAALSAPPRNCDVGTAEEQCQRMFHYCIKKGNCSVCKRRKNMSFRGCILDWAQMPCEEGGAE